MKPLTTPPDTLLASVRSFAEDKKSIVLSKTFWMQVITLGAVFFPGVQAWISANPVEPIALLAAVNVIIRFATSGKVGMVSTGDDDDTETSSGGMSGGASLLIVMGVTAGLGGALPSCSPAQVDALRGVPIRIGIEGRDAAASYSSKGGLVISARVRATK